MAKRYSKSPPFSMELVPTQTAGMTASPMIVKGQSAKTLACHLFVNVLSMNKATKNPKEKPQQALLLSLKLCFPAQYISPSVPLLTVDPLQGFNDYCMQLVYMRCVKPNHEIFPI